MAGKVDDGQVHRWMGGGSEGERNRLMDGQIQPVNDRNARFVTGQDTKVSDVFWAMCGLCAMCRPICCLVVAMVIGLFSTCHVALGGDCAMDIAWLLGSV